MPSVIFGNMHPRVFDVFTLLFNEMGWKVYIPSTKEKNYFGYGVLSTPTKGEYTELTYKEFLDVKPDVVLCLCWQHVPSTIKLATVIGSKLVLRAGNNNVPYNNSHGHYLISNDLYTHQRCNIKNKLFFYLPADYDFYSKMPWPEDSRIISSYIQFYEAYWAKSWQIYNNIRTTNKDLAFINYGAYREGTTYSPMIARPKDIVRTLGISRCMLHVKESEGYGWSILEAISCGIPVIAVEKYVKGKTCESFLTNKTAILLKQDASEFRAAFNNTDLLRKISEEGPKFIREFINLEEQAAKLKDFMENIVL